MGPSMLENVSEMGPFRALHPREYRGAGDVAGRAVPPVLAGAGIAGAIDVASTMGEERKEAVSLDPRQAIEVLRSLGFTLDMGDE